MIARLLALLSCGVVALAGSQSVCAETIEPHRGGTLRLVASASGGTIDPQINYTSQYINLFTVVYDGLTGFRREEGEAGDQVVADLAESLPTPQDGGRTWVFRLRSGIRFSNGAEVTTQDVAASMRRIFRVGSPTAGAYYSEIVGGDACLHDPAHCTLEGGVSDDPQARTITFHLVQPDTEFVQKLAFTHAVILPASTPDRDLGNAPAPGTGPYRISAYDPNTMLHMERNPYFRVWDADVQPDGHVDRIEYSFGMPDEAAVTAVENGQFDWMKDDIPLDRLGELGARFPKQTHIERHFQAFYAPLNVNIPPFNNEKARQAINYAMDRRAMVIFYGGSAIARPLCDMMPSGMEAHVDTCPYSRRTTLDHPAPLWAAPDLERARELVRESGTWGQKVTVIAANNSVDLAMATYMRDTLRQIGYQAGLRTLSPSLAFTYVQNTSNKVQISIKAWAADYPAASNFLDDLLGCENFHPGSDSSVNIPGFCDPEVQKLIDRAKSDTSLTSEQIADLWRQAGQLVTRRSPMVPIIEMSSVLLTSPRLGGFFYTDVNQMLFSKVWVQ